MQVLLYGIGTTVGAGIYALLGEIAGVSGYLTPWSFLLASFLAGFTAISFAQLSSRFPRTAGAALYVQEGFGSVLLARWVGYLVILAGVVSSAALLNGFVGYLQEFVGIGRVPIIIVTALVVGLVALWGVSESVWIAGAISVLEVGGLVWIVYLGSDVLIDPGTDWRIIFPDMSLGSLSAVSTGAVLAFYAYIGFEDMVEVAEEVKNARKNLPRAILLTLVISTLIYMLLVTTAIMNVDPQALGSTSAPLAYVYRALTESDPWIISFIGLFAIINGVLIQIIMASRVLYGLANRGQLPSLLAKVNSRTRTPTIATTFAVSMVLMLALFGNLSALAETTAVIMLSVFAAINLALWRILGQELDSEKAAKASGVADSLESTEKRAIKGYASRSIRISALIGFIVCAFFVVKSITSWLV